MIFRAAKCGSVDLPPIYMSDMIYFFNCLILVLIMEPIEKLLSKRISKKWILYLAQILIAIAILVLDLIANHFGIFGKDSE